MTDIQALIRDANGLEPSLAKGRVVEILRRIQRQYCGTEDDTCLFPEPGLCQSCQHHATMEEAVETLTAERDEAREEVLSLQGETGPQCRHVLRGLTTRYCPERAAFYVFALTDSDNSTETCAAHLAESLPDVEERVVREVEPPTPTREQLHREYEKLLTRECGQLFAWAVVHGYSVKDEDVAEGKRLRRALGIADGG